jgi:hypothetical protein
MVTLLFSLLVNDFDFVVCIDLDVLAAKVRLDSLRACGDLFANDDPFAQDGPFCDDKFFLVERD